MPRKIYFLGWDEPAADKVSRHILGDRKKSGPTDLGDVLIISPTLNAGRRLREVMTLDCAGLGSVLLSVSIVTPHHFFSLDIPDMKIAGGTMSRLIWTRTLGSVNVTEYRHLFPGSTIRGDTDKFVWALNTGEILERLRQELADGGYSIGNVLEKHGENLEERDRWENLAALEKLYLAELKKAGFEDSCTAKINRALSPEVDPAVRRIIVAGVPDPSMLAVRALEKLSAGREIEILVYAPESQRDNFDEWGRPIPEKWSKMNVDIPAFSSNVFMEISPADQSTRVREILAAEKSFGPLDIVVGVPDTTTKNFLQKDLQTLNLPAFDPSDIVFSSHSLGRLVECAVNLLQSPVYETVAALIRHPDFLLYLEKKLNTTGNDLLSQLDQFQNFYLPPNFRRMLEHFAGNPKGTHDRHYDFTVLGAALKVVSDHIGAFGKDSFENTWRAFLKAVYEDRRVGSETAADREFTAAAGVLEETLREFRDLPEDGREFDNTRLSTVFLRRLGEQQFHRERTNEIVDLQGWLELPWSDAPCLLVTGMNEEFVPGGSMSDAFLPDSLREKLGMRSDLARFGRDVYLMQALIEPRRKKGRTCFMAGKCSMNGDPLKPSRLLFRCPDDQLPQRAKMFFDKKKNVLPHPPAELIFKLNPARAGRSDLIITDRQINVTALAGYLQCPFRFYLSQVLGMEELRDDKMGLDSLDFGSIVHAVLEEMGRHQELWACEDSSELGKALEVLARKYTAARYGLPLPLAVQLSLESAVQRMNAAARHQVELVREGWRIIAVEQKKAKFKYRGFEITGKIDRVDRNEKDGRIRIIDYKTSDKAEAPWEAHMKRRDGSAAEYNRFLLQTKRGTSEYKWVNLQLPAYHLIYTEKEKFESNIELAYFNLPKAVSATGISTWVGFGPGAMESALICLNGVLDGIGSGVFWPPSETVKYEDFERLFIHEPEDNFELKDFKQGVAPGGGMSHPRKRDSRK